MKQITIDDNEFNDVVNHMNKFITQLQQQGATYKDRSDLYQCGYNLLYNIIIDGMEDNN